MISFPQSPRTKSLLKILLILGGFALCALLAKLYLTHPTPFTQDPLLRSAMTRIKAINSYRQTVDTDIQFPTRKLRIIGTYDVDNAQQRYASLSTTTLFSGARSKGADFTLANISIGPDIYTRIETNSPELKRTIPATTTWQHFTKGSIPLLYTGIAIAGPVLDNLRIFEHDGAYLTLTSAPSAAYWGTEYLTRYSFAPAHVAPAASDGTLAALLSRISATGTIDVWIDSQKTVRYLVFQNENYHSTTTLSDYNTAFPIVSPIPTHE